MLVSSHLLAEVAQTVDQVLILDDGHLVAASSLAELTAGGSLEEAFLTLTSARTTEDRTTGHRTTEHRATQEVPR